ncbi:phage tail protein [Pseudomonas guariconensis]|uniref:phage tail protein n=1 Tax=Pseudomonas guariconensis TaxID=1288410 RepID=UPI0018ABFA96|nr:phage tail protein [Pseudomonas guariconensis]MBF8720514.1 phage tail protein [Pseudomonas guariconensis]
MPWYRTGTVAITAGQTTVTGTGTNFSANARVGDALLGPDGTWYEVTNIASATVLSILPAYKGATVSGGTYAITPVQGYTKTLADKFNDIANTWGSTLAGLGSVSTENVVPVTKGGTGGTTQATARNGLGLKSAAVADIVGTVSQSSGVPTGAIMETGKNANGTYVKYADGTMICWKNNLEGVNIDQPAGPAGLFITASPGVSWTFPVAFSGPDLPFVTCIASNFGGIWFTIGGRSLSAVFEMRGVRGASYTGNFGIQAMAIGRWY